MAGWWVSRVERVERGGSADKCCQCENVASSNVASYQFIHSSLRCRPAPLIIGIGPWQHSPLVTSPPLGSAAGRDLLRLGTRLRSACSRGLLRPLRGSTFGLGQPETLSQAHLPMGREPPQGAVTRRDDWGRLWLTTLSGRLYAEPRTCLLRRRARRKPLSFRSKSFATAYNVFSRKDHRDRELAFFACFVAKSTGLSCWLAGRAGG